MEVQAFMATSKSFVGPVLMIDANSDKPLFFTCGFYVGMIWSDTTGGAGINQS